MNERIKELAERAGFSAKDLHIQGDDFQRFAELIINKCGRIADDFRDDNLTTLPSEEMKRHFGVPEKGDTK